jgi:hypothetical protein
MSIGTYAELQAAVASWCHRTGDTDFEALVPDWIALLEAQLSARIKGRSMEARTSLSCVAANAYVTLPTDVMEVRRLIISSTDPKRVLKYVSPEEITTDYPHDSGEPVVYTVIGGSLQLAPIPDSTYTLELAYFQKIPALSDSNTTNWLLTSHPNIYLYGTLAQVQPYVMDDGRFAMYQQLYADAVQALNLTDWYSGSTMSVRAS